MHLTLIAMLAVELRTLKILQVKSDKDKSTLGLTEP